MGTLARSIYSHEISSFNLVTYWKKCDIWKQIEAFKSFFDGWRSMTKVGCAARSYLIGLDRPINWISAPSLFAFLWWSTFPPGEGNERLSFRHVDCSRWTHRKRLTVHPRSSSRLEIKKVLLHLRPALCRSAISIHLSRGDINRRTGGDIIRHPDVRPLKKLNGRSSSWNCSMDRHLWSKTWHWNVSGMSFSLHGRARERGLGDNRELNGAWRN